MCFKWFRNKNLNWKNFNKAENFYKPKNTALEKISFFEKNCDLKWTLHVGVLFCNCGVKTVCMPLV